MKLVKLLANLGYGSRKEVQRLIRSGVVTDDIGTILGDSDLPLHDRIRLLGEHLDPASPLVLILNKPDGYTCSTEDPGQTIYDLLPPRFAKRNPGLNSIGWFAQAEKIHRKFIREKLSPGGCADLLSGTLFFRIVPDKG